MNSYLSEFKEIISKSTYYGILQLEDDFQDVYISSIRGEEVNPERRAIYEAILERKKYMSDCFPTRFKGVTLKNRLN